MEQTWLETCFSAHPYNKGYIYTHIPPTRSSRTNRLAKGTRICFQTWKDLGLLDLTNLGILPREPKSYWVFSSRRDSTRSGGRITSPPFRWAVTCGTQTCMPKPTRVFASLCIPSRSAWERLWEADSSPLPQRVPTSSRNMLLAVRSCLCQWHQALSPPRGARRAGASRQTRSEPVSCGEHRRSPSRHHCPASGGLPATLQSPRSFKHPREKRKLEKAVGFELSRRLPALCANGKAGFAFRRRSLPTDSSQMCAGVWGW